jgi:hypothetical protein
MIADNNDDPNRNVDDMRASCNGTHAPTDRDTFDADTPESPWYRAMKAGMAAWEMWQDMSDAERLDMILTQMPQQQWYLHDPYTTDNLSTLAAFRSDAKMWGYIKAVFKSKGGNPWDLERAVEQALQEQAADAAPHAPSSVDCPRATACWRHTFHRTRQRREVAARLEPLRRGGYRRQGARPL